MASNANQRRKRFRNPIFYPYQGSGTITKHKTSGSFRTVSYIRDDTNKPGKQYIIFDGLRYRFVSDVDATVDVVTDWALRYNMSKTHIKNGFRNPTGYTRTLMRFESGRGYCDFVYGTTLKRMSGVWDDSSRIPWNVDKFVSQSGALVLQPNVRHRAEVETLIKLKDMKVNFGEALAESRSTIHHLSKTAKTLLSAYSYAKKGKWSKLLKTLKVDPRRKWSTKDPASRWLEVQFGWTPLINDIHGSMELAKSQLRSRAQLFAAERNIVQRHVLENISTVSDPLYSSQSLFTGTRGVAVKLYARVRDEDIANLTSLGLTDPLQVAWALVPFSFVIDWIVPVGSFLEALGATKGLDFVSGTCTEFVNGHVNVSSKYAYSKVTAVGPGWTRFGSITAMSRSTYKSFPSPIPYIKSPFSTSHIISTLALIRSIAFKH